MRILFLSTWFPFPADNGSKIRAKYLIHALAQQHDLTLLSFAFDTASLELAAGSSCQSVSVIEINPFLENRTGALKRFLSTKPVSYQPITAMRELVESTLKDACFEVIIASTGVMATYALQSPQTTKVLEEHNSLTRMMRERYENSIGMGTSVRQWLSWQKTRRYEAHLFNQFNLVTMVSEQDRETSENNLPGFEGHVEIVPNGVDCQNNRPGLASKRSLLLVFNGSLTYDANHDAMVYFLSEIYPLIRRKISTVSLIITGSTKGVDLETLGLDESVQLTGYVDDIRIPVSEATVCIVPLRVGGGSRLKILEAMALGTPVVATQKGAEGLDVTHGNHLLIADDPQAFANNVLSLLGNHALCNKLSLTARALVEAKYNWRQIGKLFVNLIEQTVG